VGEETDIVSKEMYAFEDQGGDHICLRPEGTAGAVRAYLQAGLTRAGAQRWFYMGPMFRRERPQKGRLRQFQQIGVEWFGVAGPLADAELLAMAQKFLNTLGIHQTRLELNTLGCSVCRPVYHQTLVTFLESCRSRLCETCNERVEKNPMRVLDCKNETCQQQLLDAPEMVGHVCRDCDEHFTGLKEYLDALHVSYQVNPRIVRGLDYYNRTAFEFVTDQLGAQGTVLAGGRYDGLVESLGGAPTTAIGFAAGMERLAMLLPEIPAATLDAVMVTMGDEYLAYALQVADEIRAHGFAVVHAGGGAMKRQFKQADRERARFVVVVGEDEAHAEQVTLKNLATGEQQTCSLQQAIENM